MPTSRAFQHSVTRTVLLATDLQRSVLAELDRTGPNPFAYTPYGEQSRPLAAGARLGFNGQLRERSTGWYHLGNGHRVYNPVLMRFQSPDWLSPFEKGGLNAYAYCKGDPINYVDPTGKFWQSVLPFIQRGLTAALHTMAPAAMLFAPAPVTGVALHATRFSLLGSVGSFTGAVMSSVGMQSGAAVSAAGTGALVTGAAVRGAVALKAAYQSNKFWKILRDNVRSILGLAKPPKAVKTAIPDEVISQKNSVSSSSGTESGGIDSIKLQAEKIRQP
ncbi:MAG: RHS repeat-associated core domain-containing protein [Pseudomonas sp.]|uniref:RHS repeat-associated core domain-containing protein n=1 Tax=Pseudomonas sp. TaxID=306 RepID=UPI003D6FBEEB